MKTGKDIRLNSQRQEVAIILPFGAFRLFPGSTIYK